MEFFVVVFLYVDFVLWGVKFIGFFVNNVVLYEGWIKDINVLNFDGFGLEFFIIGDEDRIVLELYGMLDKFDKMNVDKKGILFMVRIVFVSKYYY